MTNKKREDYYIEEINSGRISLKDIKVSERTESVCLAAVKVNADELKYVKNQTGGLCMKVVRRYPEAVKRYGLNLKYVKNQNEKICKAAVEKDKVAIAYINPELYEYSKEDINDAYVEITGNQDKYYDYREVMLDDNIYLKDLIKSSIRIISGFNDDLLKAFNNHKIMFKNKDNIKKVPELKALNEKIKMLKAIKSDKNIAVNDDLESASDKKIRM